MSSLLALDAGQGHSLQEGALHAEKDDDQRQRRERRGRHQQVPLGRVLSPKGEESQGERILTAIRQVDQRPKELVPSPDKAQERRHHQRRSHQRQHDLPEDAKLSCAIDPGRIGEFLWQSEKELAQQEDEKGITEKGGDNERGIGTQQTKVLEEHEGRDEDDDPRDQHGGDSDGKEQVSPREVQTREAIADRGTGQHRAQAYTPGIKDAVPQEAQEGETRIVQRAENIVPPYRIGPP